MESHEQTEQGEWRQPHRKSRITAVGVEFRGVVSSKEEKGLMDTDNSVVIRKVGCKGEKCQWKNKMKN